MNRVEAKWQQLLAAMRRGLEAHDLPPMPGSVERSLEHAYVTGMVSYRSLMLDILDAIDRTQEEDVEGLHLLDRELMERAVLLGIDNDIQGRGYVQ